MPNAPAVMKFTEQFFELHKATAPTKYWNDLIMAGMTYNKGGYHSEIEWLKRNDPDDYSIQRPADRTSPANYGAAVDITFRSAQGADYTMITHYMRLARAGITSPKVYAPDGQTNTFREMIGTLDGESQHNVSFTQERILPNNDPRRSHMWHIHFSFTRKWLNDFEIYEPLLDLLFPDRPLPVPPPKPAGLFGLDNNIMEDLMPLQLVQVPGDDAVYALAPTGAVHVKNVIHLEYGQRAGLFTRDRWPVTADEMRALREIEPEGIR